MEVIIEILLDLIVEATFESLFILIGKVFNKVNNDKKSLKRTKIIIYSILAIGLLTLLTISICYKKGLLVILALSYFVYLLIAYYLIFFFKTVTINPNKENIVRWSTRILKYAFVITLFILGLLYLEDQTAKIILCTSSGIGIIIYIFIDSFRFYRYTRKGLQS